MAKQIDKKWIADGAIDGSKIKLLEGQSLVIEVAGQPVELLKLNENGNASLPQGEVPSTEAVNQAIATEVTALSQEIAQDLQVVESGLAQEILDRQSAVTSVEQSVAAETLARETAITSVEQSVQTAQTDISGLESDLAQEILDRQSGDSSTLSSAQSYTDQKVAALVNSAPEVLDTLKELSDALGGDANFAATVAGQIGAVDDKVDQEIIDRQAGDSSLQTQIDVLKYYTYDQVRYVAKNGDDANNGGQNSPFLTVSAALASITDASATKRYVIRLAAGNYTESSVVLKANVFIVGDGQKETVRLTGAVSLDSSFSGSADNRSGFSNLILMSAADFNWQTVTSAAGKLYFNEVSFNTNVSMYGHTNATAQAQFANCIFFGNLTVSGINVGVFADNTCFGNISLNQHPNGGMATVLNAAGGYCSGSVTLTTTVNDFNRRCGLFARSFYMGSITVDGPSSYADMTDSSIPNAGPTVLNGGNVVYMNAGGANKTLSNLSYPTAVNQPIMPANTNATNFGDWGKQWNWSFGYVHASTGTDLYLISYGDSYGADSSGKSIGIYTDGAGLQENVNGGEITIETAATSGTGVRGKVILNGREIDVTSKKITNLADGTLSTDAVNKGQLDSTKSDVQSQIDAEKARIDAILLASEADKDSFAEIVSLINSVDTENDTAFAGFASSTNSAISSLEDRVETLEGDSDIIEVESIGEAPALGLVGKLYVAKDSNKLYRWATVGGGSLTFDKVVGSGEAYATLQDALAAAVDGENILVKAGTYLVSSTINVNKQVKIVGEDKDLVIFETAATTSAPVSMFNVSVDNVALAKMTIKHKKTSNTSVETAVVASGPGFPQTRIANFIMENCVVEYAEFGLTVRAESWCVRNTTFTYATGSVSNSCRAIGIYGNKGNSFIKDVFLKNDVLNGTASRPFYLTSTTGSNPNETTSGKLVIEGTTHVGPLAQFFNQDNQQSEGAGTFELQIKNNVINESNLFAAFYSAAANAGEMFSSITLSGNSISNLHAVDGGKGLYGVAGTASFRTSPLVVHASNNTLGQEVYRTGWMAVEGTTVGKETAVPAFTVSLDSIIPASGDAPQVAPASSSSYVEVSPEPDLSGIESDISSLESADVAFDSRISALENAPDAVIFEEDKKFIVDGINVNSTYIDLEHSAKAILKVGVNRLNAYKNQDYTVSEVNGVTRLTWANDLAANGLSEIAGGDVIYVSYAR